MGISNPYIQRDLFLKNIIDNRYIENSILEI